MQIETRSLEAQSNAPSDSWFAPLAMFIAWLARMFDSIARMKRIRRTTKFKPTWREHFADLRYLEWHRDQIMAAAAAELLAGREPDLNAVQFYYDPPDDFGGPCPKTPFDMNRRFLAVARWHTDPMAFIRRHAHRIAKRARITLGGCPLRHAARDTSPKLRLEEESNLACGEHRSLSSPNATHWGRCHARACAHDGGGSHSSRGPPTLSIPSNTHPCRNAAGIAPACLLWTIPATAPSSHP